MAKKNRIGTKGVAKTDIPDFEGALAEVENVVRRLEGGELGLTEALAEYERGIAKIKICHEMLQQAELKIRVLTQVDEDGTPRVESVDRTPPNEIGDEESGSDMDGSGGLF
ncbi:MAG: exodeoxyribonuclease VII small subunit [Planctomycetota bacterium]